MSQIKELSPIAIERLTVRPANAADAAGLHAVFVAADLADGTSWAGSLEEYEQVLTREDLNPVTDTRVVLSPDGRIIAAAWFIENHDQTREHYTTFYGAVHPEFCKRGIGTWLMEWLESTAGEKLAAYADQKPRSFTVTAAEGLTAREDLFQRRGYRPVRTYYKMRCELSRNAEKPNIPEGFAFAAYSQEVDSDVHRMIDTAFSEHKKYQPHTPDLWALHTYRSQDFCPEASGLVYEGDTLAGASVCSIWAEDNARLGVQEGWVDMLGVLKEYRKRGIASALLLQAMNSFRALGMDYAGLFVDSENETGALALYERLGFRRIMSAIRWTKQLDLD